MVPLPAPSPMQCSVARPLANQKKVDWFVIKLLPFASRTAQSNPCWKSSGVGLPEASALLIATLPARVAANVTSRASFFMLSPFPDGGGPSIPRDDVATVTQCHFHVNALVIPKGQCLTTKGGGPPQGRPASRVSYGGAWDYRATLVELRLVDGSNRGRRRGRCGEAFGDAGQLRLTTLRHPVEPVRGGRGGQEQTAREAGVREVEHDDRPVPSTDAHAVLQLFAALEQRVARLERGEQIAVRVEDVARKPCRLSDRIRCARERAADHDAPRDGRGQRHEQCQLLHALPSLSDKRGSPPSLARMR